MYLLKEILLWIMMIIVVVISMIGVVIGITIIQEKVFVPDELITWVVNLPTFNLIFIYELIMILGVFYLWDRFFVKKWGVSRRRERHAVFSKYKKIIISFFVIGNLVLLYAIVTAMTVVTEDEIIVHSFASPQGKVYSYHDIVEINTGVYGKNKPFMHSKGDFFYIIKLEDGTEIDLTEMGSSTAESDEEGNEIVTGVW